MPEDFEKNLDLLYRALEYCKILVEDVGESLENQNADRNAESKDQAPKVSGWNKDCIRNETRGRVCFILTKNLSVFYTCPKTCLRLN